MTVKEFAEQSGFRVINLADNAGEVLIRQVYCCDLLSIAMTKVPEGAAWVTVMSNINTLAVASLTEAACVIVAEMRLRMPNSQRKQRPRELPYFIRRSRYLMRH